METRATDTLAQHADPSGDLVLLQVPIEDLAPDPYQPRTVFNEQSIRELAASIEQHGLLQPLLVRPRQGPGSQGKYWIVGGERRYRAATLLGMRSLPCRVQPYANLSAAVVALVENVHREDLSEIDKAEALSRIKTTTGKSWEEVAGLVKLSHAYVRRLAGLLKLEEPVKEKIRRGELAARTAIALKPLPPREQVEMAERVVQEGLTAEEVRAASQQNGRPRPRPRSSTPALLSAPAPLLEAQEDGDGRDGHVVRTLRQLLLQLEQMSEWLDARDWAPSRLSPEQQELVHRLYHAASQLQQQTAQIRLPLKEVEDPAAEKLRHRF